MTDTNDQLAAALNAIADPVSGKGLIDSERAPAPRFADGIASVILDVTDINPDKRALIEADINRELGAIEGVDSVRVAMTSSRTARRTCLAVSSPVSST